MSREKVYRTGTAKRVVRGLIKGLLITLLVLIVAFVGLFFYLRRYIVYDADGRLHLDLDKYKNAQEQPEAEPAPEGKRVLVEWEEMQCLSPVLI